MSFMLKKKKYKFQVDVQIEELSSVPLVNAVLYAKIRLLEGGNFIDTSSREEVTDHTVKWNANFSFICKMSANANTGILDPCVCRVSIRKELKGGKSFQKLGFADVNLSEFAGSGKMTRFYLLEGYDAKHRQDNSTLKLTISMSISSGDPCFKVPTTRPHSLPGDPSSEQFLFERGRTEEFSGGSVTSGSSGIGSLPRKNRSNVLTSELVSSGTVADTTEANVVSRNTNEEFELTHSRNSSSTSQQSKASGYSSMHSRQSSSESGHAGNPNWPGRHSSLTCKASCGCKCRVYKHSRHSSLDFVPGHHRPFSSISSFNPSTLDKAAERKRKQILEEPKESRVDSTRVNAKELVNELVKSFKLHAEDNSESQGLQLYVAKDGTATLGSHEMQSCASHGNFEPVVFENRNWF